MNLLPHCLVALAFASIEPAARADYDKVGVDVVMDFTPAGKKLVPASADHPVYYLPLPYGRADKGGLEFHWERPLPPAEVIERQIAKMLAEQHYYLMTKANHPTLVLTMKWGYKVPVENPKGADKPPLNDTEMEDLVGGQLVEAAKAQGGLNARDKDLNQMAHEGRWYIMIEAIDFQDWRQHKVTPLWRESVSTELWGHYLDQVMPTMIAAAGPLIGREMKAPALMTMPVEVPEGWVNVGKAVVVPTSK